MAIFIIPAVIPLGWIVGSICGSAIFGSIAGKSCKIADKEGSPDHAKAIGQGLSHTLSTGLIAANLVTRGIELTSKLK
jgi:hypothetical protein